LRGNVILITAGAFSLNSLTTMDKNKGKNTDVNNPITANNTALPVMIPSRKKIADDRIQIKNVFIYPSFSARNPPKSLPRAKSIKYRALGMRHL